jgi:hypothetical protein
MDDGQMITQMEFMTPDELRGVCDQMETRPRSLKMSCGDA